MPTVVDIGPLTWVKSEIDSSLERARASLAAFAAQPEDRKAIKAAQTHLHQASGAVQIVGLEGVSRFFEETERLVADIESAKVAAGPAAYEVVERATRAIGKYLSELLDGMPDQPLRLYPLYREVATARGIKDISEADLYFPDLAASPPPREDPPTRLGPEELAAYVRGQRTRFQRGFLKWLKTPADTDSLADMRAAVEGVESMQRVPAQRAFWWVAGAFYAALAEGTLAPGAGTRQLCSRIEQQMRRVGESGHAVPPRVMREALYWLARAGERPGAGMGDLVRSVRETYALAGSLPGNEQQVDQSQRVPVAAALRAQLAAAKEAWNKAASGVQSALGPFEQHTRVIKDQVALLGSEELASLSRETAVIAAYLLANPGKAGDAIAMEVATALLLIENAVERYASLPADFERQVRVMLARLRSAVFGKQDPDAAQTLPLIDEMTRRAQEKLALDGAVAEMQANLQKIEQTLDAYFRDPSKTAELAALEPGIHQIEGALRVLGEEEAGGALARCAAKIAAFGRAATRPALEEFEEVAQILSGLGFYLDALRHGKADFAVAMRPIAPPPAVEPAPRAGAADASRAAPATIPSPATEGSDAGDPEADATNITPPLEAPSADAQRLLEASEETVDQELLAIFLEEAVDVLAAIEESLALTRANPANLDELNTIRRGFHTLKGSGRMVGLSRLGEAAWSVEQVMNLWLQEERAASEALFGLIAHAHAAFADWVGRLQRGEPQPESQSIAGMAEQLKLADPGAAAAPAGVLAHQAPDAPSPQPVVEPGSAAEQDGGIVRIGATSISSSLFAVFTNEARLHLDTLERELAHVAADGSVGVRDELVRAAHTLAGICGTVQLGPMHDLGMALEGALLRLKHRATPMQADERALADQSLQALRLMYAGVLERAAPGTARDLVERLAAIRGEAASLVPRPDETSTQTLPFAAMPAPSLPPAAPAVTAPEPAVPTPAEAASEPPSLDNLEVEEILLERRQRRLEDEIDPQLLPIFLEEAHELAPQVSEFLRHWRAAPADLSHAQAMQRVLHTLKGSARMAGVMSLGELTHHMETRVENAVALKLTPEQLFDDMETSCDRMDLLIRRLEDPSFATATDDAIASPGAMPAEAAMQGTAAMPSVPQPDSPSLSESVPPEPVPPGQPMVPMLREAVQARAMLRVRADALEKLVNEAGEVAITRSRIETEMHTLKGALTELTENVSRLRRELREIEIAAESQLASRVQVAQPSEKGFDALEFDRFTRFQELTRMMAESVNDVATVQQSLVKVADDTDAALAAQARLNRELQQDLMRIRMVPVGSIADRLHRVVRQASKELGKRANLEIRGANVEVDRSVLERMTGPFEHLLRNAITHGLELPALRAGRGKPELGEISLDVRQKGNEVVLTLADDGGGLDLERIRARAQGQGLLAPGESRSDQELADLIFVPGFSTADKVTELAGRGVGMDVVKNEVSALSGRIELSGTPGSGTRFTIRLPLTTAVTQSVLVRLGVRTYALPAAMVEQVQQMRAEQLERAKSAGLVEWAGRRYPLHNLCALLGEESVLPAEPRRYTPVLLVRSGAESIAVEVDEMLGNQEIVVKNIGPQLAHVPGIAGATVLGSGEIVLLINPVPLAARPLPATRSAARPAGESELAQAGGAAATGREAAPAAPQAHAPVQPRIMVVDDSLTVRKITGRLLVRDGYQVLTAKDGVEALELLVETVPDAMLVDVEMPRMDGFDLTRNVRADARLKDVPIIMITSRTADKHKNYAMELGVNVFLGKPYQEDELLAHISGFVRQR
jgi:chemosensory pili system protein ChpA (sensor histidine kinase/response regulator)